MIAFSTSPIKRDSSDLVWSVMVICVGASSPSSRACRSMIFSTRSITPTSPLIAVGHSARSSRSVRATVIRRNSSRASPIRPVSRSSARCSAMLTAAVVL